MPRTKVIKADGNVNKRTRQNVAQQKIKENITYTKVFVG